jgi:hypothetical protein
MVLTNDRKRLTIVLGGGLLLSVASFSLLLILWDGINLLALFLVHRMPCPVLWTSLWLLPLTILLISWPLFALSKARKVTQARLIR